MLNFLSNHANFYCEHGKRPILHAGSFVPASYGESLRPYSFKIRFMLTVALQGPTLIKIGNKSSKIKWKSKANLVFFIGCSWGVVFLFFYCSKS